MGCVLNIVNYMNVVRGISVNNLGVQSLKSYSLFEQSEEEKWKLFCKYILIKKRACRKIMDAELL
jgi:hypothetical protein